MRRNQLYTAEEIEAIRRGEIPEGRKRKDVLLKANQMGVFIPRLVNDAWNAEEIALLKENKPVPGRTVKACYVKAFKLKIEYCPTGKSHKPFMEIRKKHEAEIIETLKENGFMIRATGRKFGLSYTTISKIAKAAGLSHNRSPKERKGASITWGGSCWTWYTSKTCSYWRETSGKRRNLARVIYEEANGQLPKGYVVTFKNGDRQDLRLENLQAMSKSEFGREVEIKDPRVMASILAGGALGRLKKMVKEAEDPVYAAEQKAARQERGRKTQARLKAARAAKKTA